METSGTTREHIIQAAYHVLVEQGYDAATIKAIAREAGVAPGLLHYYFANKDELLVEVLKDISRRYTESGYQRRSSLSPDQLREVTLNDMLQRTLKNPGAYRLRYELFALGLRNSALQPAIRSLLESGRSGISHIVDAVASERSFDADTLASILLACIDGLALQHLAEPDFDIESAYRLLSRMVKSLLESE
jgi:AcrR family transcriptional regulator